MKAPALITLAALLGGAILAGPALRARAAGKRASEATSNLERMRADIEELQRLRARRPAISAGKRPQPNVYAHLTDALVEAGVPTQSLKEVSPGEDASVKVEGAAGNYRRQSMRVTLEAVTLPQTGRFFDVWRSRQPEWTVTSIQITPVTGKDQPRQAAQRPIRVQLVMEATYLEISEGRQQP